MGGMRGRGKLYRWVGAFSCPAAFVVAGHISLWPALALAAGWAVLVAWPEHAEANKWAA